MPFCKTTFCLNNTFRKRIYELFQVNVKKFSRTFVDENCIFKLEIKWDLDFYIIVRKFRTLVYKTGCILKLFSFRVNIFQFLKKSFSFLSTCKFIGSFVHLSLQTTVKFTDKRNTYFP